VTPRSPWSTSRSSSGQTSRCPRDRGAHTDATTDARERSRIAAAAAAAKKGDDTEILDVGDILGIADTFVITSAPNTRLVRTIVDEVERRLRDDAGVKPDAVEGLTDASWVLLDYGDVVVHVFLAETREFYGLERLWSDAPRIAWEDVAAS
jgi:ribosome-associated protein